jgi:hypothetical protein
MLGDSQEPETRQAFRWITGAVAAFCLVLGVFIALRQTDIPLAICAALALGFEMATIALRGKLPGRGRGNDRRFQFRLRTLMIVVTLLAVACAASVPKLRELLRGKDHYLDSCEGSVSMISARGLKPIRFRAPVRRHDGRLLYTRVRRVERPATKS